MTLSGANPYPNPNPNPNPDPNPTQVTLSGEATLREENMDVIVTEQHLRLMQPGTLGQ